MKTGNIFTSLAVLILGVTSILQGVKNHEFRARIQALERQIVEINLRLP